jgi:hypothetical protein
MVNFEIKFRGAPALKCQLDGSELSQRYLTLLKKQYHADSSPIFRDQQLYTIDYFRKLATTAKSVLGWDWVSDKYEITTTTRLHKDLEEYLSKGFAHIPEEHDHLLHELHFCLHSIESGSSRGAWLQIEWFNDEGFDINSEEYPAKLNLDFGDIRLQNPYVGHHPLFLYEQQDDINVSQTCKFHDFVKPGINIVIDKGSNEKEFDWQTYLQWFETAAPDFVSQHGIEQLKKFTGHPVVGTVINKSDLAELVEQPVLEFESIVFNY